MQPTATDAGIPKLYHYEPLKPEYLCNTLTNNRVHFSSPSRFNDPWDCSPRYVMDRIDNEDCTRAWSEFLLRDATVILTPEEMIQIRQHSFYGRTQFLERTVRKATHHSREITATNWRIYCLTPHPDSLLMWAHYAEQHKGLCLEFDTSIAVIGRARKVKYDRKRPLICWQMLFEPETLAETMVLIKSKHWKSEKEFRIMCRNGDIDKEPTTTLCKTTGDFLDLPADALTRVIVGARGDYELVKKLVKCLRPDVDVCQARIADEEYKIIIL